MRKIATKPYWVMFFLVVFFMLIFEFLFKIESSMLRSGMAAAFAVIFSPRTKIIDTQNGKVKQITWMFLKEPITLQK